ncbi:enoyl-CoA hydratase/isomerase family protein [Variovorax sp. MHTC-1]|uniref:enoyl-CoA hydratase/isomerase family protein n=1 Tax=Variovorax sp. MHTC-1 TaxID=2495593 RepID=UPI000F88DDF1|nr:hypothetical protein EJI01_27000 [Variovorax sp. MHTC-1]
MIFSITDGQACITLNRPSRLNSFSESMYAEIADAVRQVSDPANGARMLLFSGAGRAFCAGVGFLKMWSFSPCEIPQIYKKKPRCGHL